ncbi:MAG: helix-turn-helix transcriptional regulator [Eubacteriales bacterium]
MECLYRKLYGLLKQHKIRFSKFKKEVELTKADLYALEYGDMLNHDTLSRICLYFKCDLRDIMEIKNEFL